MGNKNEGYLRAASRVAGLVAVNDCAERGVALIEQFNSVVTTQEEQRQFLLQVVAEHRKTFGSNRKDLVNI
jgi:hypothetical protein